MLFSVYENIWLKTNVYTLLLQLAVLLLMKHTFDVIYGTEEYPFTVFTVKKQCSFIVDTKSFTNIKS